MNENEFKKLTADDKILIKKVTGFYKLQQKNFDSLMAYHQAMSIVKKGHGYKL